jgi:hypothetical protein
MTQDFVMGQLRLALVAALAFAGGHGWLTPADSGIALAFVTALGPLFAPWIWSVVSNINTKRVPKDSVAINPHTPSDAAAPIGANVAGKVIGAILVAFAMYATMPISQAQAQIKTPGQIVRDIQEKAAGPRATLTGDVGYDLIKALDAKLLPDLQYALKLATATNSTVTAPCWQAWIDMIQTQQQAVQDTSTTPPTDIPTPDPHVITSFERLVELRNSLQPESQFMLKCSPVASMVKLDIAKFMGLVISGGAGIAALVPGL